MLGALFRSNDYKRKESELVILVTPYLATHAPKSEFARPDGGYAPSSTLRELLMGHINRIYGPPGYAPEGRYDGRVRVHRRISGCGGEGMRAGATARPRTRARHCFPPPRRLRRCARCCSRPAMGCASWEADAQCRRGRPEQPGAAPPDRLHGARREPRCGGAGGRPRPEPKPARRRLPLPPSLQARGDRAAGHPGAGQRARPGGDRPLAAGHPAPRRPRPASTTGCSAGRAHDVPAGGPPAIRLAYQRPVAVPPPCDQWTEDVGRNEARIPYPELGLRHPAQPRRHGRQRARPAAAAGGGSALERATQRDLVGLRGQQWRLGRRWRGWRRCEQEGAGIRSQEIDPPETTARPAGLATTRLVLRSSSQYRAAIPRIGRSQRNGEPP